MAGEAFLIESNSPDAYRSKPMVPDLLDYVFRFAQAQRKTRGARAPDCFTEPRDMRHRKVLEMTDDSTLWDLEERFWTQGADSARRATAKGAVFVLPFPAGILQGDALWREKDVAQRWRSVVMSERYLSREGDIAVLAYHVSAERSDQPIYEALCTSTYLNDDGKWQRLAHQQTPVG
jgi:hypothetical protein